MTVCLLGAGCASMASPAADPAPATSPLPTSATVGDRDIVAIAVPAAGCCKKQTLPEFLGLDRLGAGIGGLFQRVFSRFQTALGLEGKFPGLQPKPPLTSITDPSNLSEDAAPSVQAAAKVKAEQDKAAQKIQGLRYLATIGCGGCYPEVEDALLAALDDCTEAVRYEAVKALRGKRGTSCCFCNQDGCCSAKVQKKLREVTTEVDKSGNYVEKSERVRRLARVVLSACPPAMEEPSVPEEGPQLPAEEQSAGLSRTNLSSASTGGSGVQQASFETAVANELPRCLAAVNGRKIFATDFADNQTIGRAELFDRIHQQVARLQFLKENPQFLDWDESLRFEFQQWLSRKGLAADVTERDLELYYQQNLDRYSSPPRVRWESVSVAVTDSVQRARFRQELETIRTHLNRGEPLPPVSLPGASVRTFDWTDASEIDNPQLQFVLFDTPVGKASGVVEVGDHLLLARILQRREAEPRPLVEVRESIREELTTLRTREATRKLYDTFKSEFEIWTIFDSSSESGGTTADMAVQPVDSLNTGGASVIPSEFEFDFRDGEFDLEWGNGKN